MGNICPVSSETRIKLAIFDLDGTLVDSLLDLAGSVNAALEELGYPTHDPQEYRYFVGNGAAKLAERALPEYARSKENTDKVLEGFAKHYSIMYNRNTRPYDGIAEVLRRLRENGVMTAVASNKPDVFTQKIISEMFGDVFAAVLGKTPEYERKPDPGIVYAIKKRAEEQGGIIIRNEEIVFIGDSAVDMETARNAHTKSIGCTWGFRTEDELVSSGAGYVAHVPEEICDMIFNTTEVI